MEVPKKVLILEDDESLRTALSRLVRTSGYLVSRGDDGSYIFEVDFPLTDLYAIVTDQHMLAMGGLDVIKELARQGLEIPVLLFSGAEEIEIDGKSVYLNDVVKQYPFATFMSKIGGSDSVLEWLESLDQ